MNWQTITEIVNPKKFAIFVDSENKTLQNKFRNKFTIADIANKKKFTKFVNSEKNWKSELNNNYQYCKSKEMCEFRKNFIEKVIWRTIMETLYPQKFATFVNSEKKLLKK